MTTIHVYSGLTGSNRKEQAKLFATNNNYFYLSSDDVRKEFMEQSGEEVANNLVYEECYRRIKKLGAKEENIVFDATNLYSKHRKNMLNQLKSFDMKCYFVMESLQVCIDKDCKSEEPVGENQILKEFMTTEIPFKQEGWNNVFYEIEHISPWDQVIISYVEKERELLVSGIEPVVASAKILVDSGKPLFDALPEMFDRRIGYNNMSAQIAMQILQSCGYDIEYTYEVIQLILFKKRFRGTKEEKGLAKLKEQLGESLYEKLKAMMDLESISVVATDLMEV